MGVPAACGTGPPEGGPTLLGLCEAIYHRREDTGHRRAVAGARHHPGRQGPAVDPQAAVCGLTPGPGYAAPHAGGIGTLPETRSTEGEPRPPLCLSAAPHHLPRGREADL